MITGKFKIPNEAEKRKNTNKERNWKQKSVQELKNEKFGKIEILFKDEQFYFPVIENAEILGYKNSRDVVKRHCVKEFPHVVKHEMGTNTGLAVQTI